MYALSIHQPYAELIRLGVKTWETGRSWRMPDHVIGQRIAICSTVKRPDTELLDEWESQGLPLASGWWGDGFGPLLALRDDDAPSVFERGAWTSHNTTTHEMPLGVVRCTATVAECLPVVDQRIDAAHILTGDGNGHLWIADEVDLERHGPGLYEKVQNAGIIDDQLPYGYWLPGTWATRLVDVRPTDPIPVKGRQRLWRLPADVAEAAQP